VNREPFAKLSVRSTPQHTTWLDEGTELFWCERTIQIVDLSSPTARKLPLKKSNRTAAVAKPM
jgi:hypothetical protein